MRCSGFDPACFEPLYAKEGRHFWFQSRNKLIEALVQNLLIDLPLRSSILEVGCGTGNVLRILKGSCSDCTLVGMDLFWGGLSLARRRSASMLVQADMLSPPFGQRFHLIGLFDVLEHHSDDESVLRALNSLLLPGAKLLVTVPAHQSLWSYFDKASHHHRRYAATRLESVLRCAGFDIDYLSQFMAMLFPVLWLGRRLSAALTGIRRVRGDEADTFEMAERELRIIPVLNEILKWVLSLEVSWVARGRTLPIGTSLVAIATKRDL